MSRYQGPRGRVPGNPQHAQFKFSEATIGPVHRSVFNRSHSHKTSFNEGYLIPILVDPVLPGDTFNLRMTAMVRMTSPLLNPIMDNLYLESFWFFVPSRLVWTNWEAMNGAQPSTPSDSTSFILPTLTAPGGGVATGDLADYMGWPIGIANYPVAQALPFRCYNLIWNEWFKDENLQNSVTVEMDNGPDTYANYTVLQRGKRKDYFTSALPWTQKINDGTVVTIGLSGTAPVTGIATNSSQTTLNQQGQNVANMWETNAASSQTYVNYAVSDTTPFFIKHQGSGTINASNTPQIFANLAAASGISVNSLRQAFQLQRLFERDARGGTRYVEILWSHFGVRSPDFRLQRPELLSTGYSPVNVHPVPQTSASGQTGATTTQGNLAAFATASIHGHGFTKSFVEHGFVIGLISVRADLSYSQGIERFWLHSTRYDHFWPTLSHIGEQAIFNQEIYLSTNNTQNNAAFGYTGRYNEYRYKPSLISGLFRPEAANTLDIWHLSQHFGSLPTLGSTFIVENAPMSRIKAVTSVPDFIIDAEFNYKCARPMTVDATPGMIDHF